VLTAPRLWKVHLPATPRIYKEEQACGKRIKANAVSGKQMPRVAPFIDRIRQHAYFVKDYPTFSSR
jgi:hypothetical protein